MMRSQQQLHLMLVTHIRKRFVARLSRCLLGAEFIVRINLYSSRCKRHIGLMRLCFTMREPVICIGAQTVMHMKNEESNATLPAGSRCEVQ